MPIRTLSGDADEDNRQYYYRICGITFYYYLLDVSFLNITSFSRLRFYHNRPPAHAFNRF